MKRLRLSLALLTLWLTSLYGQTISPHVHVTSNADSNVIDGAQHPELIPDAVAYRLFFVALSQTNNTSSFPEKDQARLAAQLHAAGIQDADFSKVSAILANFKAQYEKLIDDYNRKVMNSPTAANSLDQQELFRSRDQLVLNTKNTLESQLSIDTVNRLDAHVQREKQHMRIPKETQ